MTYVIDTLLFPLKIVICCSFIVLDIYLASLMFSTLETHKSNIPYYANTIQPIKRSFDSATTSAKKQIASFHLPRFRAPRLQAPSIGLPQYTVAFSAPAYRPPFTHTHSVRKTAVSAATPMPQTILSDIITPSKTDDNFPVIAASQLATAQAEVTQAGPTTLLPASVAPLWPLHGRVTTEFGVPEPPYQPIHTGMDISSGYRSGVMPIKPFIPGKVVQVIYSYKGLGNHVIVDHGNGITSFYCHMKLISVHEGQVLTQNDIVGYEGATGVVTGTHLHFEIRKNNIPVNPRNFIKGNPF